MSSDLHAAALQVLLARDPSEKCRQTKALVEALRSGELTPGESAAPIELPEPGRPVRPHLVSPRALPQRGLGTDEGRAAFLHAITHIEFNAINLALDAVYRFRDMPDSFYTDWARVADDEARHFQLLQQRLQTLGFAYGDFDAHNGLWDMARKTAHDCLIRMALVPRVLEARGLDVTPGMITRLHNLGDTASVAVLEVILEEEVSHVAIGTHWYQWCCARAGLEPISTFQHLLDTHAPDSVKPPFNSSARMAAGFSADELAGLEQRAGRKARAQA